MVKSARLANITQNIDILFCGRNFLTISFVSGLHISLKEHTFLI